MTRSRSALLLAILVLLLAGPAAGDPGSEKEQVDRRIDDLASQAADKDRQAGVLTEELSAASGRVRELDGAVAAQQARLDRLAADLAAARARVASLDETIAIQTRKLTAARRTYRAALARLERRVHSLYVSEDPDLIAVMLGAESLNDVVENVELLERAGQQDTHVVTQVATARDAIIAARAQTRAARREVASLVESIAGKVAEQRGVVSRLAASRDALRAAQADRRTTLAQVRGDRAELLEEIDALEQQSRALASAIRASQAAAAEAPTPVPASGTGVLRWPVSGPVTSTFGMRWGRMHEGIDIAVPEGTPVGAAAAGTVIYAGWMDGYGYLVAIDHGGGLSTAYGHNSSLTVSVGQTVTSGQTIAASGNTGHSTGPHVHFEVRVGGNPVDPLGYL
ncbi:MAG: peptidoglycan DD-metalloendopeptidase family protein [Gaiellales bacterium]